jgi:hypothetical protein
MSKFAKLVHTLKEKGEEAKVQGKSRREDYTAMKVYVPKDLHRRLKLKAVEEGKEISELVEEALKGFLEGGRAYPLGGQRVETVVSRKMSACCFAGITIPLAPFAMSFS